MIQVYPVEIEAYNEDRDRVFSLRAFDEGSAELKVDTLITAETVDEFCNALKQSIHIMQLKYTHESNS